MDEVDIENADDLNELESYLYSQIHHQSSIPLDEAPHKLVAESNRVEKVIVNKAWSKRYWADGQNKQHQQQNTKHRVRSQNAANTAALEPIPNKESVGLLRRDESISKTAGGAFGVISSCSVQNVQHAARNTPLESAREKSAHSSPNTPKPCQTGLKRVKNPFARKSKKVGSFSPKPKQGPFFKQQQKLEKAKLLENKKQKSKNAIAKKTTALDIVDLVTSDESDSSDVILIPVPPPPTYSLVDSDDGEDRRATPSDDTVLEQEENALDSTDVLMSKSASFMKPQLTPTQVHGLVVSGCDDKRIENSSRCTSPCSIQSSDEFIGQTDRSRLLQQGSGMADDEDLLLLTSDVNSLLEAPRSSQRKNDKNKSPDTSAESIDPKDNQQFATPKTTSASHKLDYRVEGQFRAVDVYESESDITDSVYSKGTPKTTVIRQVDTSSEEVEDITTCSNPRTKRLRKRRRSSGNKSSDPNNGNQYSSCSDEHSGEDDENDISGAERTGIPFISRGPAVEKKIRKHSRTHSNSTVQQKSTKSDHMSDGDFIAKINNLVQVPDDDDNDDSDEINNAPSAREIAEKVLGDNTEERNKTAVPNGICKKRIRLFNAIDQIMLESANCSTIASDHDQRRNDIDRSSPEKDNAQILEIVDEGRNETAVPNGICKKRIRLFNAIDQIIMESANCSTIASDHDQRRNDIDRSSPEEDNPQILEIVDDPTPSISNISFMKKHASDGSPIYNVVYSRGKQMGGGIGWNDEMRKFYQDSWNGERFFLSDVWKKMNPDRNLWKISNEDRYSKPNKRNNNMKCTNCCEFGHVRHHCKRPMKPRICYMCGDSGHHEPRCPNTICLRCGNKTQVFVKRCNACLYQNRLICPICKIRGHSIDHCPDKWRRYYATTEPNAYPNKAIVYNTRKFCSICGNRGHLSDYCRYAMNFMEYPIFSTAVKSHQKSYNDMPVIPPFAGIGLNLMYEPFLKYNFDISQCTTSSKYYGRFLNAVGMGSLMGHKRKRSVRDEGSARKTKKSNKSDEPITLGEDAPNQVPEITESKSVDNESSKDAASDTSSAGIVESTVSGGDIQLNVVNTAAPSRNIITNFKSPNKVLPPNNPPPLMDSDSNYSFSEHFDDVAVETQIVSNETSTENTNNQTSVCRLQVATQKPKSRPMETLDEFIPLVDPNRQCDEETAESTESEKEEDFRDGISRKFVAIDSNAKSYNNENHAIASYPCEAKIFLSHVHSNFLLSAEGHTFMATTAQSFQLKARLDFTSVGYVLVLFGLCENQDKFQRKLLLKYREISNNGCTTQIMSKINVPKRTIPLIRLLQNDISQLLTNLGNVNYLHNRLQYLERQQSKSGLKMADKVRRLLNMILVGQAGLQEGNVHLDKLLVVLKTLIDHYRHKEVAPSSLRSEIAAHWKLIFSAYKYSNYQDLVNNYNILISQRQVPRLIINPLLLDTSLTNEQRDKLEQSKQAADNPPNLEQPECVSNNSNTPKPLIKRIYPKRKQSLGSYNSPSFPFSALNNKMENTPTPLAKTPNTQAITPNDSIMNTPIKSKFTACNNSADTPVNPAKKQKAKIMPPPPFINPDKRCLVSKNVNELSDNWKATCDTLLTEITANPTRKDNNTVRDSKLPSTFWSRESMRYLDEIVPVFHSRPELMQKIERVQNKSNNGQLSYNDYLAIIKLHTAVARK